MNLHRWNVSKFDQVRNNYCLWLSEVALKCFESIFVHGSTVGKLGYCNFGFSGQQRFKVCQLKTSSEREAESIGTVSTLVGDPSLLKSVVAQLQVV